MPEHQLHTHTNTCKSGACIIIYINQQGHAPYGEAIHSHSQLCTAHMITLFGRLRKGCVPTYHFAVKLPIETGNGIPTMEVWLGECPNEL